MATPGNGALNEGSNSKWREFARFEIAYQLRRRSIWILFGLFLFPLVGVTSDVAAEVSRPVPYGAPLAVAQHGVIMTLVALLLIAAVAGDAATRDVRTRLEPWCTLHPSVPPRTSAAASLALSRCQRSC